MLHKLRWNLVFVVILLVSLFPVFSNAPGPVLAAGEAVRGELNSWGTWGMSSSLGGTFLYETGQMNAADDASSEFKFFKDSSEWYGGDGTITFAQIFTGMNTPGSNMSFNHTQNKYYVFKWNGSDKGAVFQLTATPVNVSDVNRAPAVPNSTDTVVITATTSTAPPTEQAVWLRYTTDAWSSSTVSKLSGSGTTYSTTIPAQSGGTTVDYYIFTSSDGSSIAGSEADLMTITYDNNSGSNYSYTIADAQALWLDADTIAWNGTAGSSYKLLYDPDGGMDTAIAGATACTFPSPSAPCYVTLTSSGAVSGYPKNPNATDLPRLLTGRSDANAKHLLKGQVVVAAYNGGGALVDVTHVQPQSVLDDLYATAAVTATLGVTYTQGLTPTVYLWAPTAKSVTLRRYANSTTTLSTTHPLTADAASGVWSVTGAPAWDRDFYLFDVEVYVPSEDAVLHNLVTDPYAVSLSTNSERSQLVDLDDADLKPAGWDTLTKPALANFEDITIYEMHLRDFSINDSTVGASDRGTYLAFTYDGDGPDANTTLSDGMEHLLALQAAGLTHVHLLPSFDIASVPEASVVRTPSPNPTGYDRDGEEPQATIALSRTIDGFNWGYDPYHYGAPEGSYSTDPDGVTRILEFRRMISALNQNGLRVVMDMVYNHTSASGQADKSVLDKIVPGYYYRYDTNGVLQQTSCCPDTACEYEMMEKLMVDTLVRFAEDYRVDGFRFDLMNLHTQRNMLNVQSAINAIDPDIYLYGEGWDFGSAKDKGLTDCTAGWCYAQKYNMTGKGIGLFNDIIRDATHGGYSQDTTGIRKQGFSNGLSYDWNGYAYSNRSQSALHTVMDTLRSGLRASGTDWNGQGAPFTDDPQESVAYVEKHDNETLFDQNAFKLPHGDGSGNPGWIGSSSIPTTTLTDRVRAQNMGQSLMALSQGVPFFQMGTDILRSKSLDRNSYDSGDWFNKIYWDYSENNFGKGLPPAWDNDSRWDIMRPLLTDTTTLDPATANIEFAAAHFRELLRLRYSSPLFRLTTEADVNARASYYNDDNLLDGFLALRLSDEVAPDLDSSYENILVFFNANKVQQSLTISGAAGFTLHPLHTNGVDDDPVVQSAVFDDTTDSFTIPARTTVVFVSDQALTSPPAPSTLDWVGLLWPRGGAATRLDEG
ncbi:MAG: alpha-1,6-glucosidase domain-containing protein, partial [Chloroflexota bacterium]|nr:alpha-1,6-glucosidase domain-containing protein [Chloroflexota bacterium]